MSDLPMLINGLKVTAERNATFERRNPLDGTVATRAPAASPADAVMAVEAAAEAFKTWSETGPGMRRALLLKAPICWRPARLSSSRRSRPRPGPPACGGASTSSWPPACCARPRP
jgi:hypothetical protein